MAIAGIRSRTMLAVLAVTLAALTSAVAVAQITDASDNSDWDQHLKAQYFGERDIVESADIIELTAPVRAEDPARVPITIAAKIPQTADYYIKRIYFFVDKNPGSLGGTFNFSPNSGRADLALRARINAYSPVRAIAETSDGKLHMSRRFVKASGGCSAPIGTDLEAAMARMGKMKFRPRSDVALNTPTEIQLMVSHPNITGLQMDQSSRMYSPAHFVREVTVSFEGEEIFSAETDITISENPSFRFFFVPQRQGELVAEVTDNHGANFTQTYSLPLDTKPSLARQ